MSIPKIWMDVDTGADDALALMTACALEKEGKLKLEGVSAVNGNAPLDRTFVNSRDILSLCGREDIPVYAGAERPLIVEPVRAAYVHGESGLGKLELAPSGAEEETEKAWDALYRCACAHPGELELILTGPQTNAAIALAKYPDLKDKLRRILIMGGADVGGNLTAAAEFNIYADPHAAEAVFKSGINVVMCSLDVTMRSGLTKEEIDLLENSGTKAGRVYAGSMGLLKEMSLKKEGDLCAVHDACPVLFAVMPELFDCVVRCGVHVETAGRLTLGQTVTDRDTDKKFPDRHVDLVLGVDRKAFAKVLLELLMSV